MDTSYFTAFLNLQKPFALSLLAEGPVSQGNWESSLDRARAALTLAPHPLPCFTFDDGALPTPVQRKELAEVMSPLTDRFITHIFTISDEVRKFIHVYRWQIPGDYALRELAEFPAICERHGLPPSVVLRAAQDSQKHVAPIKTLRLLQAQAT